MSVTSESFYVSVEIAKVGSEMWHMQNMLNYKLDNVKKKIVEIATNILKCQQQKKKDGRSRNICVQRASGTLTSIIAFLWHETTISSYKL